MCFFFLGGGGGRETFRGQISETMHPKQAKICYFSHFHAKIVKFSLVLTHLTLFFFWGGGELGGRKYFGEQIPPWCCH